MNLSELIYKSLQEQEKSSVPRLHLGASIIGEKCERKIWLSFRHAYKTEFDGRILRLFRRGKEEERNAIKDLRAAGVMVREFSADGKQYAFSDGNFAGSADGLIIGGVPDSEGNHVLEIKTHSKKSFDDLIANGVKKSKPTHWAQCQSYMLAFGVAKSLYMAICKDDDRMHFEVIEIDNHAAQSLKEKAHRIATSNDMPPPLSKDPSWWQCKMCNYHRFCHVEKTTNAVHCRTCAKSEPHRDGSFFCHHWGDNVPPQHQLAGCAMHVLHTDLVPWPVAEQDNNDMSVTFLIDGKPVKNGGETGYKSAEILANPSLCAQQDDVTEFLRSNFDATITG